MIRMTYPASQGVEAQSELDSAQRACWRSGAHKHIIIASLLSSAVVGSVIGGERRSRRRVGDGGNMITVARRGRCSTTQLARVLVETMNGESGVGWGSGRGGRLLNFLFRTHVIPSRVLVVIVMAVMAVERTGWERNVCFIYRGYFGEFGQ